MSCYGKLFTAVLNNRLHCYLEYMNGLCEEQAGFRKKYGRYDHIFNLKCLIDLYLHLVEEKSSKNRKFNGPKYLTATFGLI